MRFSSNGKLRKLSDGLSISVALVSLCRLVSILVSVYDRVVDLALKSTADSVVFFASYDTELVEVVYHQTMGRESLVYGLCVIGAG